MTGPVTDRDRERGERTWTALRLLADDTTGPQTMTAIIAQARAEGREEAAREIAEHMKDAANRWRTRADRLPAEASLFREFVAMAEGMESEAIAIERGEWEFTAARTAGRE